jgi:AmmeMemoRadiSam system protein B
MRVRAPAVAGMFYPGRPGDLQQTVSNFLAEAGAAHDGPPPKAMILPHAGYVYSGAVAAAGYARLAGARQRIRRVVMLGPAHTLAVRGLAASSAEAFETPLGPVPVDRAAVAGLGDLPQVAEADAAHRMEHCLEVQLPFLQAALAEFALVPLLVGRATTGEVADVLDRLWGGPETLIVISSDLSHYCDYESARRLDADTARAIEGLEPEAIADHQACGRIPIKGLLSAAARRGLAAERLDLRNSGDTAGRRDKVVGYGAWAFAETSAAAAA